ncbi:protein NEDD1 isoform X2 [Dromiciops gliroides]|uniref:protein NEDD1 isoform X2 n=1 Tax=Dromiciops gliroides TaxID=33562 RepID=UPI001CC472A5|nr:protein NEDD1 isoform X2 [Dromiciops gliroides]
MQESIRFASSGDDIKIWDASSMTVVEQFNPHSSSLGISSLCWSSNNNFLVTASASGDKIVISSCKCKPVPLLELAEGQKQTCINLNSTSMYLVSGGLDNTVNIWDLKSKRLHRSLKDHKDEVTCVTFNWNDCYIASGSISGEIILHSITTNLSSTPFGQGNGQSIRQLKYSLFKKSLLGSVSDNGVVTLWDVNSQSPYHNFECSHKAPASGISFSPVNDMLLVTIGLDKRIILYDTASKIQLRTLKAEAPLTAVDFMPDGATLAIGSSRGKIYQYDLRMLNSPVKTALAHKTSVQCITFQCSSSLFKSNLNKGSSNKSALNKRTGKVSSTPLQNPEIVREPASLSGLPRNTNPDVVPSRDAECGKNSDLSSFDDTGGRGSLGDLFSPLRDDAAVHKAIEDSSSRGNVLDFLPQLNEMFPTRKQPMSANTPGSHLSSLHVSMEFPLSEENESQDIAAESKKMQLGKQESREPLKQVAKFISAGAESGNLNTSPTSSATRSPEKTERAEREIQGHLTHESPVNGTTVVNPKIMSSVTSGVANSLSEKIADTIGNSRSNIRLTSVEIHFIQNMIQDMLDDLREACHRDIVNLQVEMIKQFHIQLNEIHFLLERYSVNESLVAEIERLREENKKLRTNF